MHAGRASQSGFYGAILAKGGFTGIIDVFDQALLGALDDDRWQIFEAQPGGVFRQASRRRHSLGGCGRPDHLVERVGAHLDHTAIELSGRAAGASDRANSAALRPARRPKVAPDIRPVPLP